MIVAIYGSITTTAKYNDSLFAYTSLLLTGETFSSPFTAGFIDSSSNNLTITKAGRTTQGTFSPFSLNSWSGRFNGTTDYLTTPTSSGAFTLSGDFTIECWIYTTTSNAGAAIVDTRSSATYVDWVYGIWGGKLDMVTAGGVGVRFTTAETVPVNQWAHIAIVRSGSTISGYINGVKSATTVTYATTLTASGAISRIGGGVDPTYFPGYISNLRIVKGTAVYTASFAVPTEPLTAIAGTSLLVLQDNRFKDNSTNNLALTVAGTPSVQPASPFATNTAWSLSKNGGSIAFSGSSDYLTIPVGTTALQFGSSDFTVEAWVYLTSTAAAQVLLVGQGDNASAAGSSYVFYVSGTSTNSDLYGVTGGTVASPKPVVNTWAHVAWVRSGTSFTSYLNGVVVATATVSGSVNVGATTYANSIGARGNGANNPLNGYVSNLRVVKSAVYTSAFAVPTAPLAAIADTQLLLSGTNAGIFDYSGNGDFIVAGNTTVVTSDRQYGASSLYFDGTGDYIYAAKPSPAYSFGTGNFTVEFWVKPLAGPVSTYNPAFYAHNGTGSWNTNNGFRIHHGNVLFADSSQLNFTSAIANNVWTHVAIVRNGTTITAYKNGVANGTLTVAASMVIGSPLNQVALATSDSADTTGREFLNGYIDDFRITNGKARYTSTFTPQPAAEAPTLSLRDYGTGAATFNRSTPLGDHTLYTTGGPSNGTYFRKASGAYITTATGNAGYAFGTGDFTIEFWIRTTAHPGANASILNVNAYHTTVSCFNIMYGSGPSIDMWTTNTTTSDAAIKVYANGVNTSGVWQHIAFTRQGTALRAYLNGVYQNAYTIPAGTSIGINAPLLIGTQNGFGERANTTVPIDLSNIRLVKGTALYTGATNFTPPTAPLAVTAATVLLTSM